MKLIVISYASFSTEWRIFWQRRMLSSFNVSELVSTVIYCWHCW